MGVHEGLDEFVLFCLDASLEVTDRPSTDPGTAALPEVADNMALLALGTLIPSLCFPTQRRPGFPRPQPACLRRHSARWLLLQETSETLSDVRGKTLLSLVVLGRSGTVCPTSSLARIATRYLGTNICTWEAAKTAKTFKTFKKTFFIDLLFGRYVLIHHNTAIYSTVPYLNCT